MANNPTAADLNLTYAEQTAVAVSDGTYDDVLVTTKVDQVGLEAPATAQPVAAAQLWANFVDDYMRATWDRFQGFRIFQVTTTDDSPERELIYTLPTTEGVWIDIRVQAATSNSEEFVSAHLSGMYFEDGGGLIGSIDTTSTVVEMGLVGVVVAIVPSNPDEIQLTVQGLVGFDIRWTAYINDVKPIERP